MGYITFCFFPEYSMEAMDEKGPARWFFSGFWLLGPGLPGISRNHPVVMNDHLSIKNDGDLGIPLGTKPCFTPWETFS